MARLVGISVLALLAALFTSCVSLRPDHKADRILFVGNSLTYVGNLPAVFDGLATASGRPTESSMIAAAGATLTERVADGSVEHALSSGRFTYVVLQERGGDLIGGFGEEAGKKAETSLSALAATARKFGATPLYLGTYQLDPGASEAVVIAESETAAQTGVPYVAVSNHLQAAMAAHPEMQWLFTDGGHPGHDLVLLDAALLFKQIYGMNPAKTPVAVHGPMYVPSTRFGPSVQMAHGSDGPPSYEYSAEQVAHIAEELQP